jgi:hypothetical protein
MVVDLLPSLNVVASLRQILSHKFIELLLSKEPQPAWRFLTNPASFLNGTDLPQKSIRSRVAHV